MELEYCHIELHVCPSGDATRDSRTRGSPSSPHVGQIHHVVLRFRQRGPSDKKPGGSIAQYFTDAVLGIRAIDVLLSQLQHLISVTVESEIDLLPRFRSITGTSGIFGNTVITGSTSCSRAREVARSSRHVRTADVGTVHARIASPFWCLPQYEHQSALWTTWKTTNRLRRTSLKVFNDKSPSRPQLPSRIRVRDHVP